MSQAGSLTGGGGGSGVVETLTSNSGVATAVANNIDVLGGTNIGTTAVGDALTINLNSQVLQPDGTVGAPSYAFSSSASSGLRYRAGEGPAIVRDGEDFIRFVDTIKTQKLLETFNGITYSRQLINSTPTNVDAGAIFVSVDTSTLAITVRLPNAPRANQVFYIKDLSGNAAANNITVTTVGGAVNIDGVTSYILGVNYASIGVFWNGTSYEVF